MNERITKIVIDTLGKEGVVNSRVYGHWLLSDEELEKFAELIVRECAAYIDDNIGYDDCNNTYPVSGGELKDHFGVEE